LGANYLWEVDGYTLDGWLAHVAAMLNQRTEAEWLACTDPTPMLEFLGERARRTGRKGRLFGVAVCRRVWGLLSGARSQGVVELAERGADQPISNELMYAASANAQAAFEELACWEDAGRKHRRRGFAACAASAIMPHPDIGSSIFTVILDAAEASRL